MPRKAALAKAKNPAREANRKARQDRANEILDRWERRERRHLFARRVEPDAKFHDLVDDLLWYGRGQDLEFNMRLIREWIDAHDEVVNPTGLASVLAAWLLSVIRLKEMPYDEYLQTDHWKMLAEQRKMDFRYCCALDAKHPADHAHHNTYVRRGREDKNDVIPLCKACHERHHKR